MTDLKEEIRSALVEHGTKYLLPDDEFDCCIGEVMALVEPRLAVVKTLIEKARAFELASNDAFTAECPSDSCPYCTAGGELQTAIMDAEDALDGKI